MSDTVGFVELGRIVNKKISTSFFPVARGILFKDRQAFAYLATAIVLSEIVHRFLHI